MPDLSAQAMAESLLVCQNDGTNRSGYGQMTTHKGAFCDCCPRQCPRRLTSRVCARRSSKVILRKNDDDYFGLLWRGDFVALWAYATLFRRSLVRFFCWSICCVKPDACFASLVPVCVAHCAGQFCLLVSAAVRICLDLSVFLKRCFQRASNNAS